MSNERVFCMIMCIGCSLQLGGIVTPNDGHCHLDRHGMYTESLNQVSSVHLYWATLYSCH